MSRINTAVRLMKEERGEFLSSVVMSLFTWLPDKIYLKWLFRCKLGYNLDLKTPTRYNEKLQWLKLYNRDSRLTRLVDKVNVKKEVADIVGDKYVIPTYGVYNSFDEIDFDSLPDEFVLKTNVGGGGSGVIVCKSKRDLDKDRARIKLEKSLKTSIYRKLKEWPYKNVVPKILCEELIKSDNCGAINDYKIYCFNGVPKVVMIATGRYSDLHFDYFDSDFNRLQLEQGGTNSNIIHVRPKNYDEMLSVASRLSQGLPHVRVDLYNVDGKIYFGEMTFFDSSGFAEFSPEKWDYVWGDWIKLPTKQ